MIILALDQATQITGYSVFDVEDKENYKLIDYGIIDCKKRKNNPNVGLEAMMKCVNELIDKYSPNQVVFEDTMFSTNTLTLKNLAKLQGAIIYYCYINNIPYEIYMPSHWRKLVGFTKTKGLKRPELKKLALDYIKDTFKIEVTEDIADSICIGVAFINAYKNK